MNLSPLPIQKFFDNNGNPLVGGLLFTYAAGTTTKIATAKDQAGTANTNPIVLDYRGEANVWLDQTLTYKFVLAPAEDTDPPSRPIWTVDNISAAVTYASLTAQIIGQILYPRTPEEIAAGVVPVNYQYPPYWVPRYGTNASVGVTDCTTFIQNAMNAGAQARTAAYLPSWFGEALITSALTITLGRSGLIGDGSGLSRILSTSNGFTVSPGLSFITLRGFSLAASPRYTTTPNALVGINITGTTASQVLFSRLDDLFIDGYELAIQANGVCQTSFTNIDTEFCHRGLVSLGQTLNNNIIGCWFVGAVGTSTRGIAIGDGIVSNEGWMISDTLVYGHSRNIAFFGSAANKVNNCILDFGTEFGVLLQSSGPVSCTLCTITNNYIAMTGAADSGVFCANSIATAAGQAGHRIAGNNILVYGGSTLTNGIFVDGTQDTDHTIDGNTIQASTFDVRLSATAVRATVVNNHAYGPGYSFVGGADPIFQNNRGTVIGGTIPAVASAAAVTLPVGPKVYTITGVTTITSIVATGHTGDTVTLIFAGILTFTDGSNLKLSANFVTSADDTITLFCDGTNWFEISRSAN
jgi:hypothetical protein